MIVYIKILKNIYRQALINLLHVFLITQVCHDHNELYSS